MNTEAAKRLPLSVLKEFPAADKEAIHKKYLEEFRNFSRKILVLDDDPTGVQTVHDVHVYTDWTEESLLEGMQEENPLFFVLTNSRSFSARKTEEEHRLLAHRAARAAKRCGRELLVVSRGDSTLRGHYPLELEVLAEALEEETGKAFDGQILCPFFREGGRYTIDSVHYVREGEWLVPAGETEFARDKAFGYHASHLGAYVEEKSGGRYPREKSVYVTLSMLRSPSWESITELLMGAEGFQPILVDAIEESDVEAFAVCLLRAMKKGKEFLIRSAAAVPKVLGNIGDRPLLSRQELLGVPGIQPGSGSAALGVPGTQSGSGSAALGVPGIQPGSGSAALGVPGTQPGSGSAALGVPGTRSGSDSATRPGSAASVPYGGIVLIGSHVQKTTRQLQSLQASSLAAEFLEFQVSACLDPEGAAQETERIVRLAEEAMGRGRVAVVYTSRTQLVLEGMSGEETLRLSVAISNALTGVIAGLHRKPGFLIAKGGITSSDVGTKALRVRKALVMGQVKPGIPVWKTGEESKFPGLSYIIFPGNVGEVDTLREIVEMLA